MPCSCFIIPNDVLTKLSRDKKLSASLRKRLVDTVQISHELRELRTQAARLTSVASAHAAGLITLAATPSITVYDCKHTQTLPGTPVPKPKTASDATVKRRSMRPPVWPSSTRRCSTGTRSTITA